MSLPPSAIVAAAILAFAVVARRLASTPISSPILFMVLGLALGVARPALLQPEETAFGVVVLEVTLIMVLFTDAMAVNMRAWLRESSIPIRLLGLGFPLSLVLGWLVALLLLPGLDLWEAAVLAAILVPTDAALGQAVVANQRVPRLIRNALNVEGGLNDGLALPFVTIFIALALETENVVGSGFVIETFLLAIGLSAVVGILVALVGATALVWSKEHGWSDRHWQSIGLLAMAMLAFILCDSVGGSGFIGAWVAGFVTGLLVRDRLNTARELPEELADALGPVSFLLFGALLLAPALQAATPATIAYALISLTVVRILPVVIALRGTGLSRETLLYVGWFGPRGLATIVFSTLVIEASLVNWPEIVNVAMLTVALSVILHGVSARWGAARYADWYERESIRRPDLPEGESVETAAERLRVSGSR